jgi:2-keto-3-deoxy-L-rhamnonate aldolase RhmA
MLSEFFELEEKLADQLLVLRKDFGLCAVKAEFEAEGASLSDIKDAMDIGVDGLIIPMVESPFGVVKFIGAVESVFCQRKLFKSINIETRAAVEQIDAILETARGKINNVTTGRTDLSQSYFDPDVKPDSPFILDLVSD